VVWYSAALIMRCRELGYHVICQIKSDKKIFWDNGESSQVKSFAKRFDDEKGFKEIQIEARGKERSYFIVDQIVRLDKTRQVRLVISKEKRDAEIKYYISIDVDFSPKEILSIYEDRWNIETAHREANQKLGFKDYQLRSKQAIERFIQLVFTIWTGILLLEVENPPSGQKKKTLGEMVDQVRSESIIDLMISVMEHFNMPITGECGLIHKLRALGLKLGK
jgi:Transposase DDE domain